jgi:hypothetical protein
MKKIKAGTMAVIMGLFMAFASCGPNDDGGGMDQKNSDGEGEIDSTRMPNFDTTSTSLSMPRFPKPSIDGKQVLVN